MCFHWSLVRWSPCQHTSPESTELHQSINRFYQQSYLPRDITSQFGIWPLRCSFSLTFMLLRCQHNIDYHTFFDFLLEKFGACNVGTCQFEHKTSPCRAVCLCDITKEQRKSQSIATRSLPASKWDWFSWNAPNELSSLERCWQMDFCLVLFSVHIQGGFWELTCQCEGTWRHLTLLRIERHPRLIPQCPTTRRMGLLMWYTLCTCFLRHN